MTAGTAEATVHSQARARRRLALDVLLLFAALVAASVGLWAGGCHAAAGATAAPVDAATSIVPATGVAVLAGHCELRGAPEPLAVRPAAVAAALLVPPAILAAVIAPLRVAPLPPGDVPPSQAIPPAQHPPDLLAAL